MLRSLASAILLIFAGLLFAAENLPAQKSIPAEQFRADCNILISALKALHPGLYRYETEDRINEKYGKLVDMQEDNVSIREAFLRISEFLAHIKCGHTIANPYNQSDSIKALLFSGKDKLPFTFVLIGKRMIVTEDVSGAGIGRGAEVLEINGVKTESIVEQLLKYADGDGSNDGQRLYNMRITGEGEHEFFDIYFPLLFARESGKFRILYRDPESREGITEMSVDAISREERKQLLSMKSGKKDLTDEWKLETPAEGVSLLKFGTFVTYNSELDWKKLLSDHFGEINSRGSSDLIIDIRGNSGGTTEVAFEILSYISEQPLTLKSQRVVCYDIVPDSLRQYLSTWDNSFYDRTASVDRYDSRLFRLIDENSGTVNITPKENGFRGRVYLLVDEANSSATFILARLVREYKLGLLAGRATGGNLKGITGGNLFFLDLPNTGIEVDIPLITELTPADTPDSGITPDIFIDQSVEDIAGGKDSGLQSLLGIIGK
ncbi:MAG: S41 family peptidase [Ignavibacteria bacterium]|nr:S41 family peptidase [Ignavibacteria bacterium]